MIADFSRKMITYGFITVISSTEMQVKTLTRLRATALLILKLQLMLHILTITSGTTESVIFRV